MASLDYEIDSRTIHLELKPDTEYSIGRDPDCPICLGETEKVSRRHCVIFFNSNLNSFALADLYSTNGTYLNGRKIGHLDVPLHTGDRIAVGPIGMTFHSEVSTGTRKINISQKPAKVAMISRPASFGRGNQQIASQFRFRVNDRILNNETVVDLLPSGDYSELYLTESAAGEQHFLKILREMPNDLSAGQELRRAAAALPKLTGLHPYLDCGALKNGSCYMLFEYRDLPTYSKIISMMAPLEPPHALVLVYSAALILSRGCQNGIFHGNLKPGKILYEPQAGNHIAGMGLSAWRERFFPDSVHRHGQWYAAPETTAGKSVWQSDQYSLGIILFQMLTGVLPFRSDSPEELADMHRREEMPLPQDRNSQIQTIPALNAVILRMTRKDPAERYDSWEKLIADLEKTNSMLRKKEKETKQIYHNMQYYKKGI